MQKTHPNHQKAQGTALCVDGFLALQGEVLPPPLLRT